MTEVVNIKSGERYDVFIGRGSRWGNPFIIGRDGTRSDVIRLYEQWLPSSGLLADIPSLKDKVLGCFCDPLPCHGDVLARLADVS
jgi:hypothetical protein